MKQNEKKRQKKHIENYKKKERLERKSFIYMLGMLFIMATAAMFGLFIFSSNRLREMVLEKEMEQNGLVTSYITRILKSEMEDCIEILKTSETFFSSYQEDRKEAVVDSLQKLKEGTVFEVYGIMDLEGHSLNDRGENWTIDIPELIEAIKEDRSYISDVQTRETQEFVSEKKSMNGWLILAVPLHKNNQVIGAVWGSYPVASIAKKIEKPGETQRYFQIIDDEGNYISRSSSKMSFAKSLPLWEEMERYEFPNGESVAGLRREVEQHKKGTFYFQYQGKKRYVAYEPLGVNNWYVFSVLVGEAVDGYVKNIRQVSTTLMFGFTFFIIALFSAILLIGSWSRRLMEQKNHQLEVTTKLFRIIMKKTNDIPFELDTQNRGVKIYLSQEDGDKELEILNDISPEQMFDKGWIHRKDLENYRSFYEEAFAGKIKGEDDRTLVLEMRFHGEWNWKKIHLLSVDQGSVIGFLEDYNEQTLRNKELAEAKQKTKYDALTGLYNRETFVDKLQYGLKQKKTDDSQGIFALLLLDLDYFKEINDTFGHIVGDELLCDTAKSLKAIIRSSDLAGRLGGDEFVIFLKDVLNEEALYKCVNKIREALTKTYKKEEKEVTVSVSIGIVRAEGEESFRELYVRADQALYCVKRHGRNGYAIWKEDEKKA